jgi:hypothetical protein
MNTCETCRHWECRFRGHPDHDGFGTCEIADSDENGATPGTGLAYAQDADNYHAWLKTKPNFGCVQWEAKT